MMFTLRASLCQISRFVVFRKSPQGKLNACRLFSLNSNNCASFEDRSSWVVLSNDGRTIVCWHPDAELTEKVTKLLPKLKPEIHEGDSVLKVQYRYDERNHFKPGGPTDAELAKLTYTTRHRWYPNNREKKHRDPNPPVDREGL